MWYLWCGAKSPVFGKDKMATFEHYFIEDKAVGKEILNPYYRLSLAESCCDRILEEFGLPKEGSHIINGHVPVKIKDGEKPVKAGGKLYIIDGGFCKAYQKTTGIAGYTLIYSSHGIGLKSHRPFEGVAKVLSENADIESDSVNIETFPRRRYIADSDEGAVLRRRIAALDELLALYRSGGIVEK